MFLSEGSVINVRRDKEISRNVRGPTRFGKCSVSLSVGLPQRMCAYFVYTVSVRIFQRQKPPFFRHYTMPCMCSLESNRRACVLRT